MKSLLLSAALLLGISFAAFAGRPTASQNSSSITSGRQTLSTQKSSLQSAINTNNMSAAQTAAQNVLATMRSALNQTSIDMGYGSPASSNHTNQNYSIMEMAVYDFQKMMSDIPNNGSKMLQKVATFSGLY